jgi:tetratricopeptide (TPR) repeat protein
LKLGGDVTGFSPYIQAFFYKSLLLYSLGRLDDARACLDETLRLARENDETEILTWAPSGYVYGAEYTGNLAETIDVARRMIEVAEKTGNNFSRVVSLFSLGHAHLLNGDLGEARDLLEGALARARESNVGLLSEGRTLSYLAEAYLELGEHDRALAAAREGLEICQGHGMRGYLVRSLLAMGRVLLGARGKNAAPEIEDTIDEALRVGQETGIVVLAPQIHEVRAEILGLTGDEAGATRARREALQLFRSMNATGHVARLEKELNA